MKQLLILFILFFLVSNQNVATAQKQSPEIIRKTATQLPQESDTIYDEYLGAKLAPIRQNYNQIDTITAWSAIKTRAIKQSTEGGTATYYYLNGALLKIVATQYGELGKVIQEFYTLDSTLSFVLEKRHEYNRPIAWDDSSRQENNDSELFDANNTEVINDRSFFENGILIRQISDLDCGAPFAQYYLDEEQKRLNATFEQLLKQVNK